MIHICPRLSPMRSWLAISLNVSGQHFWKRMWLYVPTKSANMLNRFFHSAFYPSLKKKIHLFFKKVFFIIEMKSCNWIVFPSQRDEFGIHVSLLNLIWICSIFWRTATYGRASTSFPWHFSLDEPDIYQGQSYGNEGTTLVTLVPYLLKFRRMNF
jgi:hypothetical protein